MLQIPEPEQTDAIETRTRDTAHISNREHFPINRVVVRVPGTVDPTGVALYQYQRGLKPVQPDGVAAQHGTPIRNFAYEEHVAKEQHAVLNDAVFDTILERTLDNNQVNGVATLRQVIELMQQSKTAEIQRIIDTPASHVPGQADVELYNDDTSIEFYYNETLLSGQLGSAVYLVGYGTKELRDFVVTSGTKVDAIE